jgi:sorbitol-specific phosphotransferase system component IIA
MINSVSATWEQEQVALDTFKTYNLGHEIKQEDTSSKNQTKTKIALSKCTVSGIGTKYYTGKALTQKLVVKYGSKTLTLNKDYTVAYKNNKNIGTATITITGKGNYTGTVNKTFKISVKKGAKYTVGNYKYQITNASTNGKGTVTLIATTKKTLTSIVVGDTVKIGGKTYKVTAIGAKAFYNNTKITKVTIGKNVTTIGKSAFQSCKKLKTVIIKSSVLKKAGTNVLKGIAKKATIKVPAKKVKAYSKLLKVTCKK